MRLKKAFLDFIVLSILFCSFINNAQELILNVDANQIITGIDTAKNRYLVLENHQRHYYQKHFDSTRWEKVVLKKNELPPTNDFPYKYMQARGKNYLVHKGCGEVYVLSNDSIIRIDNSFQHKNQYFASTFVYKDDIYFWGGYGLFTYKNILTKFNFTTKEWDIIKYSDYNTVPEPRKMAMSYLRDDELFIIGGVAEDYSTTNENSNKNILNDIWKLNLTTKSWQHVGDIKNKSIPKLIPFHHAYFNIRDTLFFNSNQLSGLHIPDNKVFSYSNDKKTANEKYNPKRGQIIYSLTSSDQSQRSTMVIVEKMDLYRGKIMASSNLYKDESNWVFILAGVLGFIVVFFLGKQKLSIFLLRYKSVVLYKNKKISFKGKQLHTLDSQELKLLAFLFENIDNSLKVSEITGFLGQDYSQTQTYATLVKRKDTLFNSLISKLAFILEIDDSEILLTTKSKTDKRIKKVRLNSNYFINLENTTPPLSQSI